MPESDSIINYVYDRYNKGKGTNFSTIGEPGSGKSENNQRLACLSSEKIHGKNKFSHEDIADNLLDFIRMVRDTKKPGRHIVFEEIVNSSGARRSMASSNVNLNKILDTCRMKRIIIFFNTPIFKAMDPHIRSMCNVLIRTVRLNKRQGVCIFKAYKILCDYETGKIYKYNFERDGREVSYHFTKKPDDEICNPYHEDKKDYLDSLYEELEAETKYKDETKRKKLGLKSKQETVRPLSPQELKVYDLLERQKYSKLEIANTLGVSPSRITAVCKNIKSKLKLISSKSAKTEIDVKDAA